MLKRLVLSLASISVKGVRRGKMLNIALMSYWCIIFTLLFNTLVILIIGILNCFVIDVIFSGVLSFVVCESMRFFSVIISVAFCIVCVRLIVFNIILMFGLIFVLRNIVVVIFISFVASSFVIW